MTLGFLNEYWARPNENRLNNIDPQTFSRKWIKSNHYWSIKYLTNSCNYSSLVMTRIIYNFQYVIAFWALIKVQNVQLSNAEFNFKLSTYFCCLLSSSLLATHCARLKAHLQPLYQFCIAWRQIFATLNGLARSPSNVLCDVRPPQIQCTKD